MNLRKRFLVKPGSSVRLADFDPDDTAGLDRSAETKPLLAKNVKRLTELQYVLYAENRRAILIILQAMDAGGKDGTVRHVIGPLNPQGVRVTSFKAPSEEELAHDFLWRIHRAAPRRGEIGVFNRSHYEDVLVVRVRGLAPKSVWSSRYDQINAFEQILAANDMHVLKFYLHISRDEQLARIRKRLADPTKRWKFNPKDIEERGYWRAYMKAYESVFTACNTRHAPWFIIPANHKWFRNLAVSQILLETMEDLHMRFPKTSFDASKIRLK